MNGLWGVLIEALRGCGAEIECIEEEGYAPLRINGRRLRGGEVNVDVTVSSQFVSALLMVAPMMDEGLTVRFEGEPVSLPYILMTVGMMEQRGIKVDREPLRIKVERGVTGRLISSRRGTGRRRHSGMR